MNHGESCQTVQREHARTHFYTGSRHGRSHSEGLGGAAGVRGLGWGTQVHDKYDAELEGVQDGEQKC